MTHNMAAVVEEPHERGDIGLVQGFDWEGTCAARYLNEFAVNRKQSNKDTSIPPNTKHTQDAFLRLFKLFKFTVFHVEQFTT
jgi:hypothetical protein